MCFQSVREDVPVFVAHLWFVDFRPYLEMRRCREASSIFRALNYGARDKLMHEGCGLKDKTADNQF